MKNKYARVFLAGCFVALCCQSIAEEKKKEEPLRIALSGPFVSEGGSAAYQEIMGYLTEKTGIRFEIVTGLSYATINQMIKDGALIGGFVCGLPYVLMNEKEARVELLLAPVMQNSRYHDKPQYYSDLIVRKDSSYKTFQDLKGKVFAFNDVLSNSGYNMPRYFFLQQKIGKKYFKNIIRTGSHEGSIRAVANGNADFSFVDSLVLEDELHLGSAAAGQVRVIHSLGPAGIPPLVLSKNVSKTIAAKISEILVNMHKDPEGKKILNKALVLRFDTVDDSNYQGVRMMYEFAKKKNALTIEK